MRHSLPRGPQSRCREKQNNSEACHNAYNERTRRQVGDERQREAERIAKGAERVTQRHATSRHPTRRKGRHDERGEHQVDADELHSDGHRACEKQVEAYPSGALAEAEPEGENHCGNERHERQLGGVHPENLADEEILQMLGTAWIGREQQDGGVGGDDERHTDHRFLYLGPKLFSPVEEQRAGQRGRQRRRLDGGAVRLEPEPVGDDDAEPGDLRHGEIDEHEPSPEHLNAQRNMRGGNEQAGDKRRPYYRQIERFRAHLATGSNLSIESSYNPNKSFARSVPPTVKGSITAGTLARSASHSAARGSL